MNFKGQTALEYLLIIAGAIAIAAIAIFVAMSSVSQTGSSVEESSSSLQDCTYACAYSCNDPNCGRECFALGGIENYTCQDPKGSGASGEIVAGLDLPSGTWPCVIRSPLPCEQVG